MTIGRCPAVALEIAYHSEHQLRKFLPRVDRGEFDVMWEEHKVYLWDRQRIPKSKPFPRPPAVVFSPNSN